MSLPASDDVQEEQAVALLAQLGEAESTEPQIQPTTEAPTRPISKTLSALVRQANSTKRRKRASASSKQEVQRRRHEVANLVPRILGCSDIKVGLLSLKQSLIDITYRSRCLFYSKIRHFVKN